MEGKGWTTEILHFCEGINRMSKRMAGDTHFKVFNFLVTQIAGYVELWWNDKEETESESAKIMRVGKELLGVLKRGRQVLDQRMVFGSEILNDVEKKDFANWLLMMFGSTGEFFEIIDDVKMYCQMMNELKRKGSVDYEDNQRTVGTDCNMFKNRILSYYNKILTSTNNVDDSRTLKPLITRLRRLFLKRKQSSQCCIFQMLEGPVGQRKNIAKGDVSVQERILGMRTIGIIRKALWCRSKNCSCRQVFDHSEIDGEIVMELMVRDLEKKEKINPVSPFSLDESTNIILQIVRGYVYLHEVIQTSRQRNANALGRIDINKNPPTVLMKDGSLIVKIADSHGSNSNQSGKHTDKENVDSFGPAKNMETIKGFSETLNSIILENNITLNSTILFHLMWKVKKALLIENPKEDDAKKMLQELDVIAAIPKSELSYSTEDALGIGSHGSVKKAHWRGNAVAVKEFTYQEDFHYEYEIFIELMATDRSHIVKLYGHSETETGNRTIVMELLDTDLRSFIHDKNRRPFSLKESIDIMLRIAEGVRSLHTIGVVHRDIKPHNILVKTHQDGSFLFLKLADFGISKKEFQTGDHTSRKGTKWYMAPEIDMKEEVESETCSHSRNVDSHSFGILCIEILTGISPNSGTRDAFNERKISFSIRDGNIPDKLYRIIQRCIKLNQLSRPTFEEICECLNDLKKKEEIHPN